MRWIETSSHFLLVTVYGGYKIYFLFENYCTVEVYEMCCIYSDQICSCMVDAYNVSQSKYILKLSAVC